MSLFKELRFFADFGINIARLTARIFSRTSALTIIASIRSQSGKSDRQKMLQSTYQLGKHAKSSEPVVRLTLKSQHVRFSIYHCNRIDR